MRTFIGIVSLIYAIVCAVGIVTTTEYNTRPKPYRIAFSILMITQLMLFLILSGLMFGVIV